MGYDRGTKGRGHQANTQTKHKKNRRANDVEEEDDEGVELVLKLDFHAWYNNNWGTKVVEEKPAASGDDTFVKKTPLNIISQKHSEATELLKKAVDTFETTQTSFATSDDKWVATVMKSGTASDRLAAVTLKMQEAPLFRLDTLETLVNMASKKGRREAELAASTLKDLFINNLLPDRKLKYFADRPITHPNVTKFDLVYWAYEDKMKQLYHQYIVVLEKGTHDIIAHHKEIMLKALYDLLSQKPEQEKLLLTYVVNKFGDVEKAVSSKVTFLLTSLVKQHPRMKLYIAKEVETFLFRSNVGVKAQYYAVIFLNQFLLTKSDEDLAVKLIEIYFSLFKTCVAKGEVDNKILDAILTGINRAFPYAPFEEDIFNDHMNSLYKILHVSSFNKSIQALQLIFFVEQTKGKVSDRYYRALYERLFAHDLSRCSKTTLFFNALFKSLKADENLTRVRAMIKRLLQSCVNQEPNFVCAALFLYSELIKVKPALIALITQPETNGEEDEEERFVDVAEDGKKMGDGGDSEDEERFVDKDEDYDGEDVVAASLKKSNKEKEPSKDKPDSQKVENPVEPKEAKKPLYDPLKREPLYARADTVCLWELTRFASHYHPSVAMFANTLLANKSIQYKGDPSEDFNLLAFLDRFVYKNPKKNANTKGRLSVLSKKYVPSAILSKPVNSDQFLKKRESEVPEHEMFFYKYFQLASKTAAKKKKPAKDEMEEDIDNFDEKADLDDEFDEYLKKGMKPDLDDDEDIDMGEDGEDMGEDEDQLGEDDDDDDDDIEEELDELDYGALLGDSDDEAGISLQDDDDVDDDLDEDEDDSKGKKKKSSGSSFASADDFADMLESSGQEYAGVNSKQLNWEKKGAKTPSYGKKNNNKSNNGGSFGKGSKRPRPSGGKGKSFKKRK